MPWPSPGEASTAARRCRLGASSPSPAGPAWSRPCGSHSSPPACSAGPTPRRPGAGLLRCPVGPYRRRLSPHPRHAGLPRAARGRQRQLPAGGRGWPRDIPYWLLLEGAREFGIEVAELCPGIAAPHGPALAGNPAADPAGPPRAQPACGPAGRLQPAHARGRRRHAGMGQGRAGTLARAGRPIQPPAGGPSHRAGRGPRTTPRPRRPERGLDGDLWRRGGSAEFGGGTARRPASPTTSSWTCRPAWHTARTTRPCRPERRWRSG